MRNSPLGRFLVDLGQTTRNNLIRACIFLALTFAAFIFVLRHAPDASEQKSTGNSNINNHSYESYLTKLVDPVSLFTFVLAVSTIGLWKETRNSGLRQGRETRQALAISSRSVDIADRALTELEAPFLSMVIIESGLSKKEMTTGHDFGILKFSIANHGRTPARLIELVDKTVLITATIGMPAEIEFESRTRNTMPWGVIAPPQGNSLPFTQNLLQTHMNALAEGRLTLMENNLFFYGFVRYGTIFNQTYRMGFAFKFDRYADRWLLAGDDKYNYLKKEA